MARTSSGLLTKEKYLFPKGFTSRIVTSPGWANVPPVISQIDFRVKFDETQPLQIYCDIFTNKNKYDDSLSDLRDLEKFKEKYL